MPGQSWRTYGEFARVLFHFAREAAGAAGTRHSPRPLFSEWREIGRHSSGGSAPRGRGGVAVALWQL